MSWFLTKIPKVCHMYWGGLPMSYLQYLTMETFMKHNPDWVVHFYYPTHPHKTESWPSWEQKHTFEGEDCFQKAMKLATQTFPVDMTNYGLSNDMSEVYKSDFLRWHLLSNEGGLWSDMDILYLKPMEDMDLNIPENTNVDTIVSTCSYGHSIGFMLSSPHNAYFTALKNLAPTEWRPEGYQSVGVEMINKRYRQLSKIIEAFPQLEPRLLTMNTVYPYTALTIKQLYAEDINTGIKIDRNTIGVHWYAGNPVAGNYLKDTQGGKVIKSKNIPLSSFITEYFGTNIHDALNQYLKPTDVILNVGSGDGSLAKLLKGKITNLDVWAKFNPNILHDLNVLPLPFTDNYFDVILAIDVIEHLDYDKGQQLLQELKRITKRSILLLTPLWWTDNSENVNNHESPYYQNPYDRHKSLWKLEDFLDWKRIKFNTTWDTYFLGEWKKPHD